MYKMCEQTENRSLTRWHTLIVFFLSLTTSHVDAVCSGGTFGISCRGNCHCKTTLGFNMGCNPYTGKCFRPGCEQDYFGAICQIKQLVTEDRTFVVDGSFTPRPNSLYDVIDNNNDTYWRITGFSNDRTSTGSFTIDLLNDFWIYKIAIMMEAKIDYEVKKFCRGTGTPFKRECEKGFRVFFEKYSAFQTSDTCQTKSEYECSDQGEKMLNTIKEICERQRSQGYCTFEIDPKTMGSTCEDGNEFASSSACYPHMAIEVARQGLRERSPRFEACVDVGDLVTDVRCKTPMRGRSVKTIFHMMGWKKFDIRQIYVYGHKPSTRVAGAGGLLMVTYCYCKDKSDCDAKRPLVFCKSGCKNDNLRPPECQENFPSLDVAPRLIKRTDNDVKFEFQQWNWNTDSGDGPPTFYSVELFDRGQWNKKKRIDHQDLTEIEVSGTSETVTLTGINKNKQYEVRVMSVTEYDGGKTKAMLPRYTLKLSVIHGNWGTWLPWNSCRRDSTTYGLQRRTRECNNPRPSSAGELCEGNMDEYKICPPAKGKSTVKKKIRGPKPTVHMAYKRKVAMTFVYPTIRSDELAPDGYEIEYQEVGQVPVHIYDKKRIVTTKKGQTEIMFFIPVEPKAEYDVNVFAAYNFGGDDWQRIAGQASETVRIKGGPGCDKGFYGKDCANKCHCKNNDPCSEINGACPNGCPPYYRKDENSACIHIGCPAGWWGEECKNRCNCVNDVNCANSETGACPDGICKKRFTGPGCATKTKCDKPKVYGPECKKPCNCHNDAQCDDLTGKCGKCPPGFSGDDCSSSTVCEETFKFHPSSPVYPFSTFYCVDAPVIRIRIIPTVTPLPTGYEAINKVDASLQKTLGVKASRPFFPHLNSYKDHSWNISIYPPVKKLGQSKLNSELTVEIQRLVDDGKPLFEDLNGNPVTARPGQIVMHPIRYLVDRVKMVRIIAVIDKTILKEEEVTVATDDFFRRIDPTFSRDKTRYVSPFVSPKGTLIVELFPPVSKATTFTSTILDRLQREVYVSDTDLKDKNGDTICTVTGKSVTYDFGPKEIPDLVDKTSKVSVSFYVLCKLDVSAQPRVFKYIGNTVQHILGVSRERIANMRSEVTGKFTLITFVLLKATGLSTKSMSEALRSWNTKLYKGLVKVFDDDGDVVCTIVTQEPNILPEIIDPAVIDKLAKVKTSFTVKCDAVGTKELRGFVRKSLSKALEVAETRLNPIETSSKGDVHHVSVTILPPTAFSKKKSSKFVEELTSLLFYGELVIKDKFTKVCETDQGIITVEPVGPDPGNVKEGKDNKVVISLECDSKAFDSKEQLATDALVETMRVHRDRIKELKFHGSGAKVVLGFTLRPPTTTSPQPSGKALEWLQAVVKAKAFIIKKKDGTNACTGTESTVNPIKCPDGFWGENCKNPCNCENDAPCENTITGDCPGGNCKKRFKGPGCATKITCKKKLVYGPDCDKPCKCFNNAQCDDYSGACEKCPPGQTGNDCSIKTTCKETYDFYPKSNKYPFNTFYCVDVPTLEVSFRLRDKVSNNVAFNRNVLRALEGTLIVVQSRIISLAVVPEGDVQRVHLYIRPPATSSERLGSEVIATLDDLVKGGKRLFEYPVGKAITAKPERLHIRPVLEEPDTVDMVRILADIDKRAVTKEKLVGVVHQFFRHIDPTFSQDRSRYKRAFVSPKGKLIVELYKPIASATTFSSTIIKRLQLEFRKDKGLDDGNGNNVLTIKGGTVTYDLGPKTVPPGVVGTPKVTVSFYVKCQMPISTQSEVFKYIAKTVRDELGVSKERITVMKSTVQGDYSLITFVLLKPTNLSPKKTSDALRDWNKQLYNGMVKVVDDDGNTVCTVTKQELTIDPTTTIDPAIIDKLQKIDATFMLKCTISETDKLEKYVKDSLARVLAVAKSRLEKIEILKKADVYQISVVILPPTSWSKKKSSEVLKTLRKMLFKAELKISNGDVKICTTDPTTTTVIVSPVGPDPPNVKAGGNNNVEITMDCDSTTFDSREKLATDTLVKVLQVQRDRIADLKFQQGGTKVFLKFTLRPPTTTSPQPSGKALKWLQEVVKAKAFIIKKKDGTNACTGTDTTVNPIQCPDGFWGEHCKNPCNCENDAPCENSKTGDCPGGNCKKRFKGPGCATKITCKNQLVYGPDCDKPCNCFNNAQCDDYSGECQKCPPGHTGKDCSIKTTCTETFDFYPGSNKYPFPTFYCVDVSLLEVSFGLVDKVSNDVSLNKKILRALEGTVKVVQTRITSLLVVPEGDGQRVQLYIRPPATSSERLSSEVIASLDDLVRRGKTVIEHPPGKQIKAKPGRLHIKPVLEEPDEVEMVRILAEIDKRIVAEETLTSAVDQFFRQIDPTFSKDKTRYKKPFVSPKGKLVVELYKPIASATTFSSVVIKRLQDKFRKDTGIEGADGNMVFTIKGRTVTYDLGPKTIPPGVDKTPKVTVSFYVKCKIPLSTQSQVYKYIAKTVRDKLGVSEERIVEMKSTAQGELSLVTFVLLKPTKLSPKKTSDALREWNSHVYKGIVKVVDDDGNVVCTILKQEVIVDPTTTTVPAIIDKLSKIKARFTLKCTISGTQELKGHVEDSLARVPDFPRSRMENIEIVKKVDVHLIVVVILPPTASSTKKSSEILKTLRCMLFNEELKITNGDTELCTTDSTNPTLTVLPVGPDPTNVKVGNDNKVTISIKCDTSTFVNKEELAKNALSEVLQVEFERITNLVIEQRGDSAVLEFTLRPPTATSSKPSLEALKWLETVVKEEAFIIKNNGGKRMCIGKDIFVNPKTECPDGMYGLGCKKKCDCGPGQPCDQLGKCALKIKCPDKTFGEKCKYRCECTDTTAVCPPGILRCKSRCKETTEKSCKVTCAGRRYGEDCATLCDCKMTIACVDGKCTKDKVCEKPKKYGVDCDLDCQCAEGSTCSRAEGLCDKCKPLRYGEDCGNECGCLKASQCDSTSGNCKGICLRGLWGLNCKNECYCEHCNPMTGKCEGDCPDGRYGPRCDKECHCKDQKTCTASEGCKGCDFGYRGLHCNLKCFCKDMSSCSQYDKCPHCPTGHYGLTCEHTCDGCVGEDCDRYTGECKRGCKPERWGPGCKNKCACRLPGSCNSVDGHCPSGCQKGRTGPACNTTCNCEKDEYCIDNTCDFQCPKYHFGHDCRNVSHCPPGDTYDVYTGRCTMGVCDIGYYGPTCTSRCHCKDKRCKPTGECLDGVCAKGWYGPSCDQRCNCINIAKCDATTGACETCPVGWYGMDCSKQCFCHESVACDRHTGFCPKGCPPLRFGLACDKTCACYNGDKCERFSGTCCKLSNTNSGCSKEPVCTIKDAYGPNCDKKSNCQGNFNLLSGECSTCKTGYYGFACENQCHCKGNTGCSGDGNRCPSGCDAGWFGFHCEKPCHCNKKAPCEKGKCKTGCEAGWWGYSCDRPCNCEAGVCNQITGNCNGECMPGKFGYNCDQQCFCPGPGRCDRKTGKCSGGVCPTNRFGYGCQKQCHCLPGSKCIKGYCEKGCDKGWSGPYCQTECYCLDGNCNREKCGQCLPGRFGPRCETKCSCAGKCNELTNECEKCPPGRWGLDCQRECHCRSAAPCDRLSGKCPDDCEHGYFGYACDQNCHCRNDEKCDQFSGECLNGVCENGYYGLGCQDKCNCARPCDQKTGQCNDECIFRRYGDTCKNESNCSGPFDRITGKCTTVCRPGWYGYNCARKCSCDEETVGYCHPATGECSNGCPPTYYGYNCKNRCYCLDNNGRCPRDTGECSKCLIGWFGPRCGKRCHCDKGEACPQGTCPGPCHVGWRGEGCSEPTACLRPNRFGTACTRACHCLDDKPCHRFTGKCKACKPRWEGDTCSHYVPCDKPNVYGEDCKSECLCLTPEYCDSFTGSCRGICPVRRKGDTCDIPSGCPLPGTFGELCENKCHCKEPTCDDKTGSCEGHGGCAEFFSGDNCSIFALPDAEQGIPAQNPSAQKLKDAETERRVVFAVSGVCALVFICCVALAIFIYVAKTHKNQFGVDDVELDEENEVLSGETDSQLETPSQSKSDSEANAHDENEHPETPSGSDDEI